MWHYSYECKPRATNADVEVVEEDNGVQDQVEEEQPQMEESTEQAEVSLNVVVGGEVLNTIKLLGWIHKKKIVILVDSKVLIASKIYSEFTISILRHTRLNPCLLLWLMGKK